MLVRIALLLTAIVAAPAFAQVTPGDLTGPPVATSDLVPVALNTSLGRIVVALDRLHAPITAGNFLHYVDTHRLDGQEFYRAMHTAPDAGLIQGGVRDGRLLFPPIAHEPTSQTGLSHDDGALSAPRLAVGTARNDFTIMVG